MSDLTLSFRLRMACDYSESTVYELCDQAADALEAAEAENARLTDLLRRAHDVAMVKVIWSDQEDRMDLRGDQ